MILQRPLMSLLYIIVIIGSLLLVLSAANSTYNKQQMTSQTYPLPLQWHMWKQKHGKSYSSYNEELERHIIWEANQQLIKVHNAYNKTLGYTLTMNKMGDLSDIEYQRLYGCLEHFNNGSTPMPLYSPPASLREDTSYLPSTVDWHTNNAVTHVKDQGECCASYAFSAVGAIEGVEALASGVLTPYSEQNIIDCSAYYGNHGCAKGTIEMSYDYIIDEGISTDSEYPYTGNQNMCKYHSGGNGNSTRLKLRGYELVRRAAEIDLQIAVTTQGPIAAGIDASHNGFRFYGGGIYNQPSCSSNHLNHAVLIVGYGTDEYGKDYWLVKNSWGDNWGERGYIRMSRNLSNQCGIATHAIFPTL